MVILYAGGSLNPRWAAWLRAGSPKPSPEFPNAGAFMLWNNEQWRNFEKALGARPLDRDRDIWRMDHAAEYDAWLLTRYPVATAIGEE